MIKLVIITTITISITNAIGFVILKYKINIDDTNKYISPASAFKSLLVLPLDSAIARLPKNTEITPGSNMNDDSTPIDDFKLVANSDEAIINTTKVVILTKADFAWSTNTEIRYISEKAITKPFTAISLLENITKKLNSIITPSLIKSFVGLSKNLFIFQYSRSHLHLVQFQIVLILLTQSEVQAL